jgi:colanic acid biosynthesis glycosyl transferase WcaI
MTQTGARPLKILILGLNHAPEPVGIGPYTAEMAADLRARGHAVAVVTAQPYYPAWALDRSVVGSGYTRRTEDGVDVTRCPLYVPRTPNGIRRILHHASFALAAFLPMIRRARAMRPDIVMTVAPSLIASPVAWIAAAACGAKRWLHIQDFEVEAAFATGLVRSGSLTARLAAAMERHVLMRADRVSTISPQMCARLADKAVPTDRIVEIRNWARLDAISPLTAPSRYAARWNIAGRHVALYSGNIANKQGIGIVLEAARLLANRADIVFVVCGEGPNRQALVDASVDLPTIQFRDLQPKEDLNDLLGLAAVHLLPQLEGAADLVLPSKLTNMLASGRPVVATATVGTGLAIEAEGCGIVTPPGDAAAFANAIAALVDDPVRAGMLGATGRARALSHWCRTPILDRLEAEMVALAG